MSSLDNDVDNSYDEEDCLMFGLQPSDSKDNNFLTPPKPRFLVVPSIRVTPNQGQNDVPILTSTPLKNHLNSPSLTNRKFTDNLKVSPEENNVEDEYEEGWQVLEDGSFCYEEDTRTETRRCSIQDGKHVFGEWQSKKIKKSGLRTYLSDKVKQQINFAYPVLEVEKLFLINYRLID